MSNAKTKRPRNSTKPTYVWVLRHRRLQMVANTIYRTERGALRAANRAPNGYLFAPVRVRVPAVPKGK